MTQSDKAQKISEDLVFAEVVGTGAFGTVFKGLYKGNHCACKVLHHVALEIQTKLNTGEGPEKITKAFEQECRFLESFDHPNVVNHLSTEKHPLSGHTILVTELMDCNLKSYFSHEKKKILPFRSQLSLCKDVTSGLAYIHSKEIIHRDLCGDNILLKLGQPLPIAKISDFGMSRLLKPSDVSSTLSAVNHRNGYLPPEASRIAGKEYDQSLDVFSLGVIMIQIVNKLETVDSAKDRGLYLAQIPDGNRLKSIVQNCLNDNQHRRLTACEICKCIAITCMYVIIICMVVYRRYKRRCRITEAGSIIRYTYIRKWERSCT